MAGIIVYGIIVSGILVYDSTV